MPNYELICPMCDATDLTVMHFDDLLKHGDATIQIEGLEQYLCADCGAESMYPDQIRRNQLRINDGKRRHDGLLTGVEIRGVRDRLGLTQQDASQIFGGGTNAFSKYERGDVMQSVAMDRLLKLAAFRPREVLGFLRFEAGMAESAPVTASYSDSAQVSATRIRGGGLSIQRPLSVVRSSVPEWKAIAA